MSAGDVNEILHSHEWLHGVLVADAALMAMLPGGVHPDIRPAGSSSPALVYYVSDPGPDVMVVGQYRIAIEPTYTVRADVKGKSYGPLRPILDRVDELLHRANGATAVVEVASCTRTAVIAPYTSVDSQGETNRHAGAEYFLEVSAL